PRTFHRQPHCRPSLSAIYLCETKSRLKASPFSTLDRTLMTMSSIRRPVDFHLRANFEESIAFSDTMSFNWSREASDWTKKVNHRPNDRWRHRLVLSTAEDTGNGTVNSSIPLHCPNTRGACSNQQQAIP